MTEKKQNILPERGNAAMPQAEMGNGTHTIGLYEKVEVPKHRVGQVRSKRRQPKAEAAESTSANENSSADQERQPSRRRQSSKVSVVQAQLKAQTVSEVTAVQNTAKPEQSAQKNTEKRSGQHSKSAKKAPQKPPIRVYFLGGLNEIGKNFTVFECLDDMIIVDCGMAFPDDDMLGVDLVIPDFTFVERNADKIRGVVLTHGHEDHIGALPYLLEKFNFPIYGTKFTLALVDSKLKEHGLSGKVRAISVRPGEHIRLGCMDVEFVHVNHSVPDSVALAIHSPAGTLVHTGDFKIDCTPALGEMIDLGRFGQLGKEGVLAMLCDSTNAEREGYTKSESKVDSSFDMLFKRAENSRIIIATFASNVSRVQQIINCAVKYGRKVALSGRSMVNVMSVGVEMGYLDVPKGTLIDIDMINRYPKDKIVLVTTGSQGEPMSALTRMAFADHRKVEVGPGDFIIISARPIPGNEKTIGNVIDELMKRGCQVVYESMYDVHVSGHACREEIKLLQAIVKPKYYIPVHGEQKHLRKNASIAYELGKDPKDVFIGDIGDVVELHEDYMKRLPSVPAGRTLVDGLGVGDVGSIVLRDRKHLAEDGLMIAVCTISAQDGHIISGPDVVSRGFVYVRESEPLIEEARNLVTEVLEDCAENQIHDWGTLKTKIKDELSRMLYERTRRSPMVLPIIMEI
ncbi:MAG: Ribonuclease J [Thermocaproicibacter melissae]|uniref:ribonuclease J n=1 Tax=Thermocaproicibacter melissae TaxID=2966552 RepID=UPI0031FEE5D7